MRLLARNEGPGRGPRGKDGDGKRKDDNLSKRIVPPPRTRHPLMIWIIVSFIVYMAIQLFFQTRETQVTISHTRLLEEIEAGNLARVDISERHVEGELISPSTITEGGNVIEFTEFESWLPLEDPELIGFIRDNSPGAEGLS